MAICPSKKRLGQTLEGKRAVQSSSHLFTKENTIICLESCAVLKTQCELVKNLVHFMLWNACARAAHRVSHSVEFSEFSAIVKISVQEKQSVTILWSKHLDYRKDSVLSTKRRIVEHALFSWVSVYHSSFYGVYCADLPVVDTGNAFCPLLFQCWICWI